MALVWSREDKYIWSDNTNDQIICWGCELYPKQLGKEDLSSLYDSHFGFCGQNQENVGELAYWLSTTSTLLFLLQKTLKANTSTTGSYRSRATAVTLFSRMARVRDWFRILMFPKSQYISHQETMILCCRITFVGSHEIYHICCLISNLV